MRSSSAARAVGRPSKRFQWWWLIWAAAVLCLFGCGGLIGAASSGTVPGTPGGFFQLLRPPFGGRERVSILAVGVDNSKGKGLADTIIAVMVWPKSGEIAALSIPRDSWVAVPGLGEGKINSSHSYGGLPLTIQTVESLLGFPFDYYIEVDVEGLTKLVDAIGGVDIEVEKRMRYHDHSQHLNIDLQPGFQHLAGEQAVGYARFRHDETGDIGRIERQQKFLRAVARELLSPEHVLRLPRVANVFLETVETNMNIQDINNLKRIVDRAGPEGIRMATLPATPDTIRRQSALVLDPEEVQRTVDRVLWGQGITVAVLNGTDTTGLAARAAEVLEENGYDVLEVGNARTKTETTLVIDHRGQSRRAERVSAVLGGGVISAAPDGENPADVTVILGADLERAVR
ncbi:MAG: LCP family protein [Armatimonadota bacterium]